MELETLRDLYIDELKDLYSAENQITKALPRMIKAATHPELKRAFETHLKQTEKQIERLEQIFEQLDESPRGKKCHGMEGLLEEGKELIGEKPDKEVLDAGLISKAQHVEHYEIAGYGTVRTYARLLGEDAQADLLQQTLDEEGETDKLLTQLAESGINIDAVTGDVEEEETSDREVTRSATSEGGRSSKSAGKKSTSKRGTTSETSAR